MGEIQRHHVTHHLSQELRDILKAMAATSPPEPAHVAAPISSSDHNPPIEHWTLHDPRQMCDVVAYLDPQNQVRHVPANRTPEVPKAWRKIFLEVRE